MITAAQVIELKMPEGINILIALELGWKNIEVMPGGMTLGTTPQGWFARKVPDFARDMNEIYKLEVQIPAEERKDYNECILDVIFQNHVDEKYIRDNLYAIIHASPLQRAQAFYMWKTSRSHHAG
jgi:hypothetical protein